MKKTPQKFNFEIIVIVFLIVIFSLQIKTFGIGYFTFLIVLLIGPIVFNLVVRKNLKFKSYLIHRHNIITAKRKFQKKFDFSKEILFDKLIEVLQDSGFKIIQTNIKTGDIFAITPMSWFSFGENIYIELKEQNGMTTVDFMSVAMTKGGEDIWDKNKKIMKKC